MGLCASTPTRLDDAAGGGGGGGGGGSTNIQNPASSAFQNVNSNEQRASRKSFSEECKLQTRLESKRGRRQVVMEAGDGDDLVQYTAAKLLTFQQGLPKKTSEQTKWLHDVLSNNFFMFNEMESETKIALVDAMDRIEMTHELDNPKDIIKQGDHNSEYMYVIEKGIFEIFINDINVASLGKEKIFGELALLYDAPRAATVTTSSCESDGDAPGEIVLWRIGRDVFKYLIKSVVQQSNASIIETLNSIDLLSNLTKNQKLQMSEVLEPVKFKKNDIIIKQGDEGHIFYIIKSGTVVCQDIEHKSEDLHLSAGAYFGELALLTTKPRQRDVIATSETTW